MHGEGDGSNSSHPAEGWPVAKLPFM